MAEVSDESIAKLKAAIVEHSSRGEHKQVLELSELLTKAMQTKAQTDAKVAGPRIYGPSTEQPEHSIFEGLFARDADTSLAQRGVDTKSGAPAGNFIASLSPNESARVMTYKRELDKYYSKKAKQPVDVVIDQDKETGELVFQNPETQKWTKISGGALSGTSGAGAQSIVPAAQMAASAAIAYATQGKSVSAQLTAGGAGTAAGEAVRLTAGAALGANKGANVVVDPITGQATGEKADYTAKQIAMDSLKAGLTDVALNAGMMTALRLPGMVSLYAKGGLILDESTAARVVEDAAKSQQLVEKVAAMSPRAASLKLTSPQLAAGHKLSTEAQDMLGHQEWLVGNSPKNAQKTRRQVMGNEQAIAAAADDTSKALYMGSKGAGGQATLDAVQLEQADLIKHIDDKIYDQEGVLDRFYQAMPSPARTESLDATANVFQRKRADLKIERAEAWAEASKAEALAKPIPPQWFGTEEGGKYYQYIKGRRAELRNKLTGEERIQGKRMLPKLPSPVLSPDEKLLEEMGLQVSGGRGITLKSLNDYIKYLGRKSRAAGAGTKLEVGVDARQMLEDRRMAIQARNDFLKSTGQTKKIEAFEEADAAEERYWQFNRQLIRNRWVMAKEGGKGLETRATILSNIISKGDHEMAALLRKAVADDPKALKELNDFALGYFRSKFTQDWGGPVNINRTTYRNLMDGQSRTLQNLLYPETRSTLKYGGDLVKELHDLKAVRQKALDGFEKSFAGRISEFNAEGLENALFSSPEKFNAKDIAELRRVAIQTGTHEELHDAMVSKLRERLIDPKGEYFDLTFAKSVIENSDMRKKFSVFLGKDYVDKLADIVEVAKMATKGSSFPQALAGERSMYTDIYRTQHGPMTERGRWMTLVTGIKRRAATRALDNALSSEDGLRSYLLLVRARAGSWQAMRAATQLGATAVGTLDQDVFGNAEEKVKKTDGKPNF